MNCNDIRPLISAYYDGEATPEEYSRIDSHLVECEDCRQVLAEYRAIGSEMRALPVPVPPAGLRRDVWRTFAAGQIEARPGRAVLTNPKSHSPRPANPLANIGRGWGRAIPAGLIAAALVIFVVAIVIRNTASAQPAALLNATPGYTDPVRIQFSKHVKLDEAPQHTSVRRVESSASVPVTIAVESYADRTITIVPPGGRWDAGAAYEVDIDAPNIHLDTGSTDTLDSAPIKLTFSLPAFTATPTTTPTSTATPRPTHTAEPTAIAQATQVKNTPEPVSTLPTRVIADITGTPRSSVTNTSTTTTTATTTPTRTSQPSATPQLETLTPTTTPTNDAGREPTATPGHKGTQTPGPVCSSTPVNGFGKLWNENPVVRARLGCPDESETAIQAATQQQFEGGYMFWREDVHTILVFLDGASGGGDWVQYDDTWRESDPTPAPSTPPPNRYEPVRGFGKIWHADAGLRQRLGWATAPETAVTGAWQTYAHGSTLWTSNRYIRVLYDDFTWSGFVDTYATPTPVANRPLGN